MPVESEAKMDERGNASGGLGCLFLIAALVIGAMVVGLLLQIDIRDRDLEARQAQIAELQVANQALQEQVASLQSANGELSEALDRERAEKEALRAENRELNVLKEQLVARVLVLEGEKKVLLRQEQDRLLDILAANLIELLPDIDPQVQDWLQNHQDSVVWLAVVGLATTGVPALGLGVYYLSRRERVQRSPRRSVAARTRPFAGRA